MNRLEKFLMNNSESNRDIISYATWSIGSIRRILPNYEDFVFWLCEPQNGFLARYRGVIEDYEIDENNKVNFLDKFIDEYDNQLEKYSPIEKPLFIQILFDYLRYFKFLLEIDKSFYSEITINEITDIKSNENQSRHEIVLDIFNSIKNYYTLRFEFLKINLPYLIKEVREFEIEQLDNNRYYPVTWCIELKEPNPEPIIIPVPQTEKIKKTIAVNCKPAELAELFKMLQKRGWLTLPNSGEGVANSLLKIFEFAENKPSKESLGRNFSSDTYCISIEKINELEKIPSLHKVNNLK